MIYLEVRPSNDEAIGLYESCGFVSLGIRKDYYKAIDGREDALVLVLDLGRNRVAGPTLTVVGPSETERRLDERSPSPEWWKDAEIDWHDR